MVEVGSPVLGVFLRIVFMMVATTPLRFLRIGVKTRGLFLINNVKKWIERLIALLLPLLLVLVLPTDLLLALLLALVLGKTTTRIALLLLSPLSLKRIRTARGRRILRRRRLI